MNHEDWLSLNLLEKQSPPNFWAKLVLLTGANFALMAGAGLSTAMPAMLINFADVPGVALLVSMIVTLPALFVVVGGPLMGFLTDRFGRKPVLVGSILLGGLAGSGAYFLTDIVAILVTRALVGLSIAGTMTATNALIADYFSGQARAKFMGYQSAFGGLGVVIFMPIGGVLADLSWEYTFLVYLSVLLVFFPALFSIREPKISKSQDSNIESARLKITPTQGYIFVANFLLHFAFMVVPIFIAYYLRELFGAGGFEVGLIGGLSGLLTFVGGMAYERIGRRFSYPNLVVLGFSLSGLGLLTLGLAGTWPLVILGQLLGGFGMGLNFANLTTWIAHEVEPKVRGRANGIFVTLMFLGQFLTSLVYTPIVNLTSYGFGFVLSGLLLLLTGLTSLWVKKTTSVDLTT
jgi:MFS family permease